SGAVAAAEDLAHLAPAALRHAARAGGAVQRLEGRLDHVVRVGGADRLRHHIVHTQRLEDGAHRAARDDAGARRGGAHHDLAGAITADDVMMQCPALAQRHADHRTARLLGRLADRLRHLARLAGAVADAALAVADDDDRREAEAPAALHHLGDTVDADELLDKIALLAAARAAAARAFAARSAAAASARSGAAAWCACHETPFPRK